MTDNTTFELWVYLSRTPLFGLVVTLTAYAVGDWLFRRANLNPLVNPVLIAMVLITLLLWMSGLSYQQYFDGAQFVHVMLGPATIALAIPLYRHLDKLRQSWRLLSAALLIGSATAALSAMGIAWMFDAAPQTIASVAPKSVTTPVAIGLSERLGGLPSLTAVMVILTGIIGAALGPALLSRLGIHDWRNRGFAIGVAAHGIGTARAIAVNDIAGAFAGLGMGLNAIATAILLPLLLLILG